MSKYDIEKLKDIFYLDSKSPSGVCWKITPTMGNGDGYRYASVGDSAGFLDQYWKVKHKKTKYSIHNVVYSLAFGNIPEGYVVDHINRNPSDNSLTNLRVIPLKLNTRNRSKSIKNTSNFTGVHLDVKRSDMLAFVSTWYDTDGKKRTKSFSVSKFGIIEAQFAACKYRKQKIEELNLQGSGYTDSHGQ